MDSASILLAVALLTGPEPSILPNDSSAAYQAHAAALRHVAIRWELMDRRETAHVLDDPDSFVEDLQILRKRHQRLADAPPVADGKRFPNRAEISIRLAVNRRYRRELQQMLLLDRLQRRQIETALKETDHLHEVWSQLYEAQRAFYNVNVRRRALKQVRQLIGADAYYRGQLPPPIPIWRLPKIDWR